MARNTKENIIKDEQKILIELQKNAKENIDTIAKRCRFSRKKVRNAISHLEESHMIWGYTAIFDEEKMGLRHFVLMAKRNNKPVDEKTIDQIVSRKLEDFASGLGVNIESSFYVHGEYDWVITFTAKDIMQAKKFSDSLLALNPGIIQKITMLETLMFIRKQYVLNPEKFRLKEFL